jgi:hypothetical protein
MKGLVLEFLNYNGNHRANSEWCPVIKKWKEINQTMARRNVGFLEVRKFLKNFNNPGCRTLLSLQVLKSSKGTCDLPILQTREDEGSGTTQNTNESNKPPSQPIGWNPRTRQWEVITDNKKTQISETSPSSVQKRNSSKDQTDLEKSLDEMESIEMEDKSRTSR